MPGGEHNTMDKMKVNSMNAMKRTSGRHFLTEFIGFGLKRLFKGSETNE